MFGKLEKTKTKLNLCTCVIIFACFVFDATVCSRSAKQTVGAIHQISTKFYSDLFLKNKKIPKRKKERKREIIS